MINYKKSLLSFAAVTAIATSSLVADYLPLTTASHDFQWVSVGISGLKSDGVPAVDAVAGAFSIDGVDDGQPENVITDASSADLLPVSGMERGGKDLVKLDLITGLSTEIRIDTTLHTYLETDPVRTMYVAVDGTILFAVEYKATLEGEKLEFSVDGGNAYETILNYENIFADPAAATEIEGTLAADAVEGDKLESLTETDSVVDYDFSDNPPKSSEWTVLNNRTGGENVKDISTLRMYSYNALERKWEIFDTRNETNTNDFTTIKKAKGYWARLDNEAVDGGSLMQTTTSEKESGLVLGDPVLTTADYTAAGLAEGWNYIAFDGQQSQIRNAVSGVIATIGTDGTIVLIDASGNHSLSIPVTGTGHNVVVAKEINTAISAAVLKGTMPKTFQVKAFPAGVIGADDVVIISNRKFTIDDPGDDSVTVVKTLAGKDALLYPNDGSVLDGTDLVAVADLGAGAQNAGLDGAMSIYGEFAMVIEPLVNTDTAQILGEASIQIDRSLVSTVDATTDLASGAAADTVTEVAAALAAGVAGVAGVLPTVIDLDMAGAPKHILLAADEPFTIRDHTFTRVYTFNDQGQGDSTVSSSIDGVTATLTSGDLIADAITDLSGLTNLTAIDDADGKLLVIGNSDGESNFYLSETLQDNIQISVSGQDESRGAVKAVMSLGQLAKVDNKNVLTLDPTAIADELLDEHTISFITEFGESITGTAVSPTAAWIEDTDTDGNGIEDNLEYLDAMVAQLNLDLVAEGLTATASHNYGAPAANIAAAEITITGSDVISVSFSQAGGGADAAPAITNDTGYIGTYSGDIAIDLKFNNVATPNYTMDGPLYTMKDSNMSLRALVSGTTDLSSGTGEVTWESIDLTRNPSEWFDSQDYDLFETTANVGYWAYLTASVEENLSIAASSFPGSYVHHFDLDNATGVGTTTNFVSGTLTVDIDGINTAEQLKSARVTATFGGETIELTQASAGDVFTGAINTHEAKGISANAEIDVIIKAADGLGNNAIYTMTDLFDNVKPHKPVISLVGGVINVEANETDDDVAQFYVFSGIPLESDDPADQIADADGTVDGAGGPVSVACDGQPAAAWNSGADGITVIAVDGTGVFGGGNASDAATVKMMRILLDRSLITADNDGGTWESTSTAYDYNSSCGTTGIVSTDDTGVTVSSLTDDEEVKFAYTSKGDATHLEVPITVYVANDLDASTTPNIVKAAITYPPTYAGEGVFIELGGLVYGFVLPTATDLVDGTSNGLTSDNPLEIDDTYDASNPKDSEVNL